MEKVKLVVYVPETHYDSVRRAMGEAGAGVIGNYSYNTFSIWGEGTFKPLEGSNPTVGEVDKLEFTNEVRIETTCDKGQVHLVIDAIKKVHPYEEVAYDIYELVNL
jgi:hypothetical protein